MAIWWLSFVGEEGFLGAVVVEAGDSIVEAAFVARLNGCNPGGEVMGIRAPTEELFGEDLRAVPRYKLLSRGDLKALGIKMKSVKASGPCVCCGKEPHGDE